MRDRDCFELRATGPAGRLERFFFDAGTGLLLRHVTLATTVIGRVPEQIEYDDYRDVDGLKEPFKVTVDDVDPWAGQTRRITELKHNVEVGAVKFARPAGD